jgi:hypothetical protein
VHARIWMVQVHKIVCTDPLCALKPTVVYELSQPCEPCGPRELTVVPTCLRIRLRRTSTTPISILKPCLDVYLLMLWLLIFVNNRPDVLV